MLRVSWAASGEDIASFDAVEFWNKSAKELKQRLSAQIGYTRFRQKLILEDGSEMQNDDVFLSPQKNAACHLELRRGQGAVHCMPKQRCRQS